MGPPFSVPTTEHPVSRDPPRVLNREHQTGLRRTGYRERLQKTRMTFVGRRCTEKSISAGLFVTFTAPVVSSLAHKRQAVQPAEQIFRTSAPLSREIQ